MIVNYHGNRQAPARSVCPALKSYPGSREAASRLNPSLFTRKTVIQYQSSPCFALCVATIIDVVIATVKRKDCSSVKPEATKAAYIA